MSNLLTEWGVKTRLQKRIESVLGEQPPEPPALVLEEGLANEYFAYYVLKAEERKFTVRNAASLIGGDFNKIAANVKSVKLHLKDTLATPSSIDPLAILKEQIRTEERRRLGIELDEQESFYLNKIAALETAHAKDHDKIIILNAKLSTENAALSNENKVIKATQVDQEARERELNKVHTQTLVELRTSAARLEGMQSNLDEKHRSIKILQESNSQTIAAYSSKLHSTNDELDEYRMQNKKLLNEITAQRISLDEARITLLETTEKLEQKNLKLNEQLTLDAINRSMDKSLSVLQPIPELVTKLIESKNKSSLNIKTIITAINSVDGKVADVSNQIEGLAPPQLNEKQQNTDLLDENQLDESDNEQSS